LAGKFVRFLELGAAAALVALVAQRPGSATWTRQVGNGVRRLEAILVEDEEAGPQASAFFLPPSIGEQQYGRTDNTALMTLAVASSPVNAEHASTSSLEHWYRAVWLAIELAVAFDAFLTGEVQLATRQVPLT
jgi:hypothetical protein